MVGGIGGGGGGGEAVLGGAVLGGTTVIWSPCRTTGHFLLLVFDDCESSLTILSLVRLVFIMGSYPLDMSLKRVSAMDYNSF